MNCLFCPCSQTWRAVGREGHWPILSPYSWVCGNLAGEFQYGSFSVFVNAVIIADLEISAHISSASGCRVHRASFCSGGGRIFARARSPIFSSLVDLCRARRFFERLDHLLGRDRLVRRAWCFYMAALGVVGRGARTGFTAKQMEVPLAGAVCLSRS